MHVNVVYLLLSNSFRIVELFEEMAIELVDSNRNISVGASNTALAVAKVSSDKRMLNV